MEEHGFLEDDNGGEVVLASLSTCAPESFMDAMAAPVDRNSEVSDDFRCLNEEIARAVTELSFEEQVEFFTPDELDLSSPAGQAAVAACGLTVAEAEAVVAETEAADTGAAALDG